MARYSALKYRGFESCVAIQRSLSLLKIQFKQQEDEHFQRQVESVKQMPLDQIAQFCFLFYYYCFIFHFLFFSFFFFFLFFSFLFFSFLFFSFLLFFMFFHINFVLFLSFSGWSVLIQKFGMLQAPHLYSLLY